MPSRRSCSSTDRSGSQNTNISTLSNWWTRKIPRVSLPAAPASRRKQGQKTPPRRRRGAARPAPEAGREARVAQRQVGPFEDLARMKRRERDLARADQVQVVVRQPVDLL